MRFPGKVPTLLQRGELEMLQRKAFTISLKYDGERKVLVSNTAAGEMYLVDRAGRKEKLPWSPRIDFVLDCELMEDETYVILDILSENPEGVHLLERLNTIELLFPKSNLPQVQRFFIKPYARTNDELRAILVQNRFRYDGFIVKPVYGCDVYKWKLAQTIDFALAEDRQTPLINYGDEGLKPLNTIMLEGLPSSCKAGDVLECEYAGVNLFKYVKTRFDKIKPNFVDVVNDTLRFLADPVDWREITALLSSP
jgi:hypothetical protein